MRVTSSNELQLFFPNTTGVLYSCTRENGCINPLELPLIYDLGWKAQLLDAPLALGEMMMTTSQFAEISGNFSLIFNIYPNASTNITSNVLNMQVLPSENATYSFPPLDPGDMQAYLTTDNSAALVWYFPERLTSHPRWIWLLTCINSGLLYNCANINRTLLAFNGPYNGDIVFTTTPQFYFLAYLDYCAQGGQDPLPPLTCPVSNCCNNLKINVVVVNRTDLSLQSNVWDLSTASQLHSNSLLLTAVMLVLLLI